MFEHLHGCVWERRGSEREHFQCMGSSSRQAREWVTNEDLLRPPSPNSQRVRGLYRDAASCPPFNHGPPPPTPLTESLRYRCVGRRWWGWGELARCPSCRIARRYWSHKTHLITAVRLLKSLRKKKKNRKKNPSWKLVPECGLLQVFNHWKGHSQKMWVPVASSLKKTNKQTHKWIQWRPFRRTSSVLLKDLKLFTAFNGTVTLVLVNHYLIKLQKISIYMYINIYLLIFLIDTFLQNSFRLKSNRLNSSFFTRC